MNMVIDDIYNSKILGFAANISHVGHLDKPDACADKRAKLCGSEIHVELNVKQAIVVDFAHIVKACVLGQASSAILAKLIIGTSVNELRALRQTMVDMLKNDGAPPIGRFADFAHLQPIKHYKERHASTLLVFDGVIDCIEQIEKHEQKL